MEEDDKKLVEQVKSLQEDVRELRRLVDGGSIPSEIEKSLPIVELEERVTNLENTDTTAFGGDIFTPDTSRSGDLMDVRKMAPLEEEELKIIPNEIEWGIPTADVTADSATVELQPCSSVGVEYASADTIDVYVCNDRSVQGLRNRGWKTTVDAVEYDAGPPEVLAADAIPGTILRFLRLPIDGPDAEATLLGEAPGLGGEFWGKITGNAIVSAGTNQWTYAFSEVEKTDTGYGEWTVLSGGRSGTTSVTPAYNSIEDINTGVDAHTEGNGVDPAHLDPAETGSDTFDFMPCTTNNIVRMHTVTADDGETTTTEYWFSYENGVDGECD